MGFLIVEIDDSRDDTEQYEDFIQVTDWNMPDIWTDEVGFIPAYQQLGQVAELWEMVNLCIENPLESEPLDADDPDMIAMLSYIHYELRGVELDPGKH